MPLPQVGAVVIPCVFGFVQDSPVARVNNTVVSINVRLGGKVQQLSRIFGQDASNLLVLIEKYVDPRAVTTYGKQEE